MNKKIASMENLMQLFEDYVDENDIISSQILAHISAVIVKYRINHHMNQQEFASFLGVSQSMISKIESSDYNFTIRKLVELCNKMNLLLEVKMRGDFQKESLDSYHYLLIEDKKDSYNKSVQTTNNQYVKKNQYIYNSNHWIKN